MRRLSHAVVLLGLTGTLVAAADLTGEQILREAMENERRQEAARSEYAYREHLDSKRVQRDGSPGKTYYSEDHEILYLEGAPYRKLVAVNGKPLQGKRAREEEVRMRMTAAERKAAPVKKGKPALRGGVSADLILRLMDHTLAGSEDVAGRKTWVVRSEPRKDVVAVSPADIEALCYRYTHWIDQEDRVAARIRFEVIRQGVDGEPGSHATIFFSKQNESAWMMRNLDIYLISTKSNPRERWQQQRFSDFKKFSADSTIQFQPTER